MDIQNERKKRWYNRIPGLSGEWNHWWLEGDGGLIIATSDLSELLRTIEEHYGKSLILTVYRAKHTPEGDSVSEKAAHVVVNYQDDKICKK
jgi:hypothetical protein